MASPLLESNSIFIKGEKKPLALLVWDETNPANDISAATATVAVYDSSATAVLTAGAATIAGTTLLSVSRNWDTSAVSPGTYRVVVTVTFGSVVQIFQFGVVVRSNPAP